MRDKLIVTVASAAHADWQKTFRAQNPDKSTREKTTTDHEWSERHGGCAIVDLLATPYEGLPLDWKGENKAGAEIAVDAVLHAADTGDRMDDAFVERVADVLHAAWVSRNPWAPEALRVPYSELDDVEQEKDRVFVRRAIRAYLEGTDHAHA